MRKILIIFLALYFSNLMCCANTADEKWNNDLRSLFLQNKSIMYALNIRTFNAKDKNGDELIDENEESGNFLNAIERLDELKALGINTIHVLPINKTGKIKALGTAGSVYAMSEFTQINPQFKDTSSNLSTKEQAKKFIAECHNRDIRVVVDLPSCGAYDMFLNSPQYFVKNNKGQPIIPLDWTDIRVLKSSTGFWHDDEIYSQHKAYVDMLIELGADGIRADVATMKSFNFWQKLISYTRKKSQEFMFLAEASNAWVEAPSKYASFTTYDKLLDAGFDGYYGDFFELKDWETSKELFKSVKNNIKIHKNENKSVIASFTTHDETSPILLHGENFSKMIIWLNATLPFNSYFVDGFQSGDTYDYQWANKRATKSYTDDDYYFNHKGKFDLFNFSRKPQGDNKEILEEFILANKFKQYYMDELSTMRFIPLRSSEKEVFAYARSNGNFTIVVIGNLNKNNKMNTTVRVRGLSDKDKYINLRLNKDITPKINSGKIITELDKGDIQVLLFKGVSL